MKTFSLVMNPVEAKIFSLRCRKCFIVLLENFSSSVALAFTASRVDIGWKGAAQSVTLVYAHFVPEINSNF
jgi:hypothetical protein